MELLYKILGMYGIAFCIAMFVAFIIWAINWFLSDSKILLHIFKKKGI